MKNYKEYKETTPENTINITAGHLVPADFQLFII